MILLGDPGGGKSTFVNHLSLCLAGHALNPNQGWLDRLPKWPETMANLLPVPVALRNLAAWARATDAEQNQSGLLLAFLEYWLGERDLDDYFPLLKTGLREGEAILLLDGLDEVPADSALRARIKACIADLPIAFAKSPILLTCRVLSYQDPAWRLDGEAWPVFELAGLDEEKITGFITAWHRQLADISVVSNPKASSARLIRAVHRPDLWRLARNPLLLTVMALVHTHRGELPWARWSIPAKTEASLVLVDELCPGEEPGPKDVDGWRNIWLAGKCLLEIGLVRANRRNLGRELMARVPTHN